MENIIEFVCVPIIVSAVYMIMSLYKYFVRENELFIRLIPIISGILGAAFGIIVFFTIPTIIPADNWLVATLIGLSSGLSATGFNQAIKQLSKGNSLPEDKNDDADNVNDSDDNVDSNDVDSNTES